MAGHRSEPHVDAYLDTLPGWRRDLGQRVRELAHAADPEVEEVSR